MKRHFLLLTALLILAIAVAAVGYTQSIQQRAAASLTGVWKGDFPNVNAPAVELTLQVQSGQPAGAVIFYQVVKSDAGAEIKGKAEAPLLDPVFDGHLLSFKVRRDDGSFYRGRVRFVADNKAILRADEQTDAEETITLRRDQ